ncbi:MAG: helix-turn-helix transcriptional regulator, partial [Bacteroidetes bacterium]|nr:helix-turn-helix transcriptional regulator [Bacteroidota bacterium]
MKLEWRLKQLLEEHHLYRYGVETKIAKDCGLHRHTIGKFLRNNIQAPKLEVLEKICEWLIEKGVS